MTGELVTRTQTQINDEQNYVGFQIILVAHAGNVYFMVSAGTV